MTIVSADNTFRLLARKLTVVENELNDYQAILKGITDNKTPVIGITGPPGAGKSTLLNSIVRNLSDKGKRIAVLAVDPTSAFTKGSLLGDRIRMSQLYNKPNVFVRSVATRGSLGGLSEKTFEMTDVLKGCSFDFIFVETCGVGQTEIEIASLADKTLLVLVPEAGDEIQNIKSGIMEIADAFIINKADRPGASDFEFNLKKTTAKPVYLTEAINDNGIDELIAEIENC